MPKINEFLCNFVWHNFWKQTSIFSPYVKIKLHIQSRERANVTLMISCMLKIWRKHDSNKKLNTYYMTSHKVSLKPDNRYILVEIIRFAILTAIISWTNCHAPIVWTLVLHLQEAFLKAQYLTFSSKILSLVIKFQDMSSMHLLGGQSKSRPPNNHKKNQRGIFALWFIKTEWPLTQETLSCRRKEVVLATRVMSVMICQPHCCF